MKTLRLFRDHYEHTDGKLVHHKAGSTVDFNDEIADYIVDAVVETRIATRKQAARVWGSPERTPSAVEEAQAEKLKAELAAMPDRPYYTDDR